MISPASHELIHPRAHGVKHPGAHLSALPEARLFAGVYEHVRSQNRVQAGTNDWRANARIWPRTTTQAVVEQRPVSTEDP